MKESHTHLAKEMYRVDAYTLSENFILPEQKSERALGLRVCASRYAEHYRVQLLIDAK